MSGRDNIENMSIIQEGRAFWRPIVADNWACIFHVRADRAGADEQCGKMRAPVYTVEPPPMSKRYQQTQERPAD